MIGVIRNPLATRLLAVSAVILLAAGAPRAEDLQSLVVQAVDSGDGFRLGLELPQGLDYHAVSEGRRLMLRLPRPVPVDFGPARERLGTVIARTEVAEYGRLVSLTVSPDYRLRHHSEGRRLVVELIPHDREAASPPGLPVTIEGLAHEVFERLSFGWPEPVAHRLELGRNGAVLHFPRQGHLDPSGFEPGDLALVEDIAENHDADGLRVVLTLAPGVQVNAWSEGGTVHVDVAAPGVPFAALFPGEPAEPSLLEPESLVPLAAPLQLMADTSGGFALSVVRPARERPRIAAPGRIAPWPDRLEIHFRWPEETAAALFNGSEGLLLAFDREAPGSLLSDLLAAAPELEGARRETRAGATVLHLPALAGLLAALERRADDWVLILDAAAEPTRADPADAGVAGRQAGGPDSLFLPLPGARAILQTAGPDGGERLLLALSTQAGHARWKGRRLPQFDLLPTVQGLALRPTADGISLQLADGGVTLTTPAGLLHSAGLDELPAEVSPSDAAAQRLLDLAAWRQAGAAPGERADFTERRGNLQQAVLAAPPHRAGLARLELARFYFAHGMAREALGALALIEQEQPSLVHDPEVRLLHVASRVLAGDYGAAHEALAHPVLAGLPEARLWRGMLAAAARRWPVAAADFEVAAPLISDYVPAIRVRLLHAAAEAALNVDDLDAAGAYLAKARADVTTTPEHGRQDYLAGRLALAEGDPETALSLWEAVAEGPPGAASARARLAVLDIEMQAGDIEPRRAIEQIEQLRFVWRGDDFEFALLTRLAELQAAAGDRRDALRSLRRAVTYYPEAVGAEAAASRMRAIFRDLLLPEDGPALPALQALSVYEEFRELTPPGALGDRLVDVLVERLVEVDLLERAAFLLEHQVGHRLTGRHKAHAGASLARVYLLDRQPGKALEALERSAVAGLPDALSRARIHLRARALAEVGRGEEGLALLAADDGAQAAELRADLLWRMNDWEGAAAALAAVLPPPPASDELISPDESRRVLNLAVAMTLAGMEDALAGLWESHGAAMTGGPDAEAFTLLAADAGSRRTLSLADELARVERVQEFIRSYREGLRQTQLSSLQ